MLKTRGRCGSHVLEPIEMLLACARKYVRTYPCLFCMTQLPCFAFLALGSSPFALPFAGLAFLALGFMDS